LRILFSNIINLCFFMQWETKFYTKNT
jgi:hypothetical protein